MDFKWVYLHITIILPAMKTIIKSLHFFLPVCLVFSVALQSCNKSRNQEDSFSFAFLTDIHIQPELNAEAGFRKAIENVNLLDPDFVITGGDLVMDALGVPFSRADSLYKIYTGMMGEFKMPVHNTVGNHEEFGYDPSSGVGPDHPMYGDRLFEDRLGKRYHAFDWKGWRFYILDSVEELEEGGYYGYIDQEQLDWLIQDLAMLDPAIPIVVSVHIPMITVQTQLTQGSLEANSPGMVITNSKQVLDLFASHNLKLVLQGHLHIYEEMYSNRIHFITAGAVCGRWWQGPNQGVEEGFLLVRVNGEELNWEYMDTGWDPEAGSLP